MQDCWTYLPAEESREGIILEAQSVICQIVRVSQDVFLGQPGEVIELDAPLRGADRDEKHFHAFVLELGQDIAVQLPCKLLQGQKFVSIFRNFEDTAGLQDPQKFRPPTDLLLKEHERPIQLEGLCPPGPATLPFQVRSHVCQQPRMNERGDFHTLERLIASCCPKV